MQAHAAELGLPKKSRFRAWRRKHNLWRPFSAASAARESFFGGTLLNGCRETVEHTFGKCRVTQRAQKSSLLLSSIRASYQSRSFPSRPSWGAGTGWLYRLRHHSCRETHLSSKKCVAGLPDKGRMKVILTMLCNRLCRTGVAAHRHPYWTHRRGWCGSKIAGLRQQHLMAEIDVK